MKEFKKERKRKDALKQKISFLQNVIIACFVLVAVDAVIMTALAFLELFEFIEGAGMLLACAFYVLVVLGLLIWRVPKSISKLKKELRNYGK